ncbi:hypothetical protein D3C72_1726950 [compost metagenome]
MAAVQRPGRHRIQQVEGLDHGAGGQHFDLQLAAGHLVDLGRVVAGELVEDVVGGPGALEAEGDGCILRPGDRGESKRRGPGDGSARDELAAGFCNVLHGLLSPGWTTWTSL